MFINYKKKHKEFMEKVGNLADLAKKDKDVAHVVDTARRLYPVEGRNPSIQNLLYIGHYLATYYATLGTKRNYARTDYEMAELAFDQIRDGIMIGLLNAKGGKGGSHTVTEAKASANRSMQKASVDVALKKHEAAQYETITTAMERMLSFTQSALRQLQSEQSHVGINDRGRPQS